MRNWCSEWLRRTEHFRFRWRLWWRMCYSSTGIAPQILIWSPGKQRRPVHFFLRNIPSLLPICIEFVLSSYVFGCWDKWLKLNSIWIFGFWSLINFAASLRRVLWVLDVEKEDDSTFCFALFSSVFTLTQRCVDCVLFSFRDMSEKFFRYISHGSRLFCCTHERVRLFSLICSTSLFSCVFVCIYKE